MMAMDRRTMMRGGAMGVAALAMDRWALVGTAHAAYPVTMTDAQWRKKLTEGQYKVLRQAATEAPGTISRPFASWLGRRKAPSRWWRRSSFSRRPRLRAYCITGK